MKTPRWSLQHLRSCSSLMATRSTFVMCCITAPLPVPASKERRMRIPRTSAAVPPACRLVAEHTAHNAAEHRYTAGGRACFGGALPASAARDVVRSTVPAQRIGLLSFGIDCGRRVVFHTAHGHDQCLYLLPILTLP